MTAGGDWRPTASLDTLVTRARLLATTRAFFAKRGVLEVETPGIVSVPVSDPQLRNVEVRLDGGARTAWLHTSPEYHMKRLLAAGAPDIYQLGKVWRDGETGRWHQPEFTLLEWYRHGFDLDGLAAETTALLTELAVAGGAPRPATSRIPYRDLLHNTLGADPLRADVGTLRERAMAVLGARLAPGLATALGDDRQGWLDLLVSHVVAPALAGRGLVVVTGYPADQALMAKLDPADPALAQRFEVYWDGLELANGYVELTDAAEQARRFAADAARRAALDLPAAATDRRLLAALASGLPDCAGVAVGFDRAVLAVTGAGSLLDVVGFAPGEAVT